MLDRDTVQATLDALAVAGGSQKKAAAALGIARSTLQHRLRAAAKMGLTGTSFGEASPGFEIARISQLRNENGTQAEWVIMKPEAESYQEVLAAIDTVMEERISPLASIPTPRNVPNSALATVYLLVDHHLGLYSWEPETGANYDLDIGRRTLIDTAITLVGQTPYSEHAVLLNVGDFFHSDDNTNRTRRSGNVLDADGRYTKILEIGIDLEIAMIELLLSKHQTVEVRNLPGNHDPYASIALNAAIRQAFKNNERVHVSRDPSPFYFFRWGKVLIGSTHGDMIKAQDMPSVLAAYAPKDWGETEHRYVYLGHVHHASIGGGEKFGATWETFRTLAPKDAWAAQSGYASGRSMVAITHHKEYGEHIRNTVTIAGPGFKRR